MRNDVAAVIATVLVLGILAIAGGIFNVFGSSTNDAMIVAGAILLAGGAVSVSLGQLSAR